MGSYKRFSLEVWGLFEELLQNRLVGIKTKITQLEVGIRKVAASDTADQLSNTVYLDGVAFDGSADVNHYAVCTTESQEQVKIVSCNGFTLRAGAYVMVRFSNNNTAEQVQLNVNNTGARYIQYKGDYISSTMIKADEVLIFQYNGTYFDIVGGMGSIYRPFVPSSNNIDGTEGLVPAPTNNKDSAYFLNAQGGWTIPHDTTYTTFRAANSNSAGTEGLVPAPAIGDDNNKFLTSVGTWRVPPLASSMSDGYMSAQDKANLDYLFHQTSTAYSVGDRVYVSEFPANVYLECVEAGTTSAISPNFASIAANS